MRFDFEYIDHADVERKRRHNMEISVANEPWRIPTSRGGWRYLTKEQFVDYKLTGRIPPLSASELRQIMNQPGFE